MFDSELQSRGYATLIRRHYFCTMLRWHSTAVHNRLFASSKYCIGSSSSSSSRAAAARTQQQSVHFKRCPVSKCWHQFRQHSRLAVGGWQDAVAAQTYSVDVKCLIQNIHAPFGSALFSGCVRPFSGSVQQAGEQVNCHLRSAVKLDQGIKLMREATSRNRLHESSKFRVCSSCSLGTDGWWPLRWWKPSLITLSRLWRLWRLPILMIDQEKLQSSERWLLQLPTSTAIKCVK